jgi:hypothetical protein
MSLAITLEYQEAELVSRSENRDADTFALLLKSGEDWQVSREYLKE